MIGQRDTKKALKAGAKMGGVSLADIEATIDEVMNSKGSFSKF